MNLGLCCVAPKSSYFARKQRQVDILGPYLASTIANKGKLSQLSAATA